MDVQRTLVSVHSRNELLRHALPYGAAVVFTITAALAVVFAPEGRSTAANIIAAALLIVAAGIAGYTRLKAKVPSIEVEVERQGRSDDIPPPA